MKPIYSITNDNQDITDKFRSNLVSITVTDEMSPQSDSVRIVLSDEKAQIGVIKVGTVIDVSLGYEHNNGEQSLSRVGRFVIDEVDVSGPPLQVSVVGRSTNFTDHLKSYRTRSFVDTTLANLVRTIASENGLVAHISEQFERINIAHIDQTDESDLNFMNRLAKQYDAVLKPVVGDLLLVPHDTSRTVNGSHIAAKVVVGDQVMKWNVKLPKRSEFGYVKAYWRSDTDGERQVVIVGDESKAGKTLQTTFTTQAEAEAAVVGEVNKLQRDIRDLRMTLHGDPELFAERPLNVSGLHPLGDGTFICKQVTHTLSTSGFVTTVSAS